MSVDGEMRVHVVAGDSAGGYLAFMTALFDSRRWLVQTCWGGGDFAADRYRPDRAVYGKARGCSVFPPPVAAVFARYVARAQSRITVDGEPRPLASPAAEDRRELPPVMIHAGADALRGDAELVTDRLLASGVPYDLHILAGTGAYVCGCRKREGPTMPFPLRLIARRRKT